MTGTDAPRREINFYWTAADLAERNDRLPLDVASAKNYALREQVRLYGNPDEVVREVSKDGKRVLFRLFWHHGDAQAPSTERVTT